VAGAEEFLRKLYGFPLAIASNAPQEEVVELCEKLGIAHYFKRVYGHPTSKVDALREVTSDWNVAPRRILYVGDRPEDGVAADVAGTMFRLIDHTGRAPYGSERLVSSFDDLAQDIQRGTRGNCSC
jgi:phosphoglycolate phosphatase-like HAD superfamily hydrolase